MIDLEQLRQERLKWFEWKNIKHRREALERLPNLKANVAFKEAIEIDFDAITPEEEAIIHEVAIEIKPWRKGPFRISQTFIDSEWQSFMKYDLLKPHFELKDKLVADVGCNNGYYMFRMLEEEPKKIVGFDPNAIFRTQFDCINHFVQSDIVYEMLGVEHIEYYEHKFDVIFCLGVIYHRSDPVGMLKSLKNSLTKRGEVILDTFMIDGEESVALVPDLRYSKIPNISFVPTISALHNWAKKAGFEHFEVLDIKKTSTTEQRRTEWIISESLNDFLDSENPDKTVEGYPAPKRLYVKMK